MTLPEILTVARVAAIRLEARGERPHVEAPAGAYLSGIEHEQIADLPVPANVS